MTFKELKNQPLEFQYQLLGRLKSDCMYFLGNGLKEPKYLWGKDAEEHIALMFALYYHLNEKPSWLDDHIIRQFSENMEVDLKQARHQAELLMAA